MSNEETLESLMAKAESQINAITENNVAQTQKISHDKVFDSEAFKDHIIEALNDLQLSIVAMSKICVQRTEHISSTIDVLNQEIQSVDGRMNGVKSATGARLAQSQEIHRIKGIKKEADSPVEIYFGPGNQTPLPTDKINYSILGNVGSHFKDNSFIDNGQSLIPIATENDAGKFVKHADFYSSV